MTTWSAGNDSTTTGVADAAQPVCIVSATIPSTGNMNYIAPTLGETGAIVPEFEGAIFSNYSVVWVTLRNTRGVLNNSLNS